MWCMYRFAIKGRKLHLSVKVYQRPDLQVLLNNCFIIQDFHSRILHPVACIIRINMNTVYAPIFIFLYS
jgi:hypothetical protein